MRGKKLEILTLIEQKPQTIRSIVAATGVTLYTAYDCVKQLRQLRMIQSVAGVPCKRGRAPSIYTVPPPEAFA
jgi:uncharacterized membrane protein